MSDLGGIDLSYREGKEEKKKKNYLRAARLFRMCHYYYTYGELPVYFSHLEKFGMNAMEQYEYCKSKLTDEAQQMLGTEMYKHEGSWRDFVRYDIMKMKEEENTPSPNRPEEDSWWRRWMKKHFFGGK